MDAFQVPDPTVLARGAALLFAVRAGSALAETLRLKSHDLEAQRVCVRICVVVGCNDLRGRCRLLTRPSDGRLRSAKGASQRARGRAMPGPVALFYVRHAAVAWTAEQMRVGVVPAVTVLEWKAVRVAIIRAVEVALIARQEAGAAASLSVGQSIVAAADDARSVRAYAL